MTSDEEWTPMDRTTAESLLRGDRTGLPLDRVLAAAKAPATARELAGEAAAVAAFRVATASPAGRARRFPVFWSTLSKLLTVKVAAAAFATTATVGGVALAANNGALPGPVSAPMASVSPSVAPEPKASPYTPYTPPTPYTPSASAHPRSSGSPSAGPDRVADLCREFTGRDRENRRRALDDERFRELVRQAGEKDRARVEGFCGIRPSGSVSARPTWEGDRRPPSRPRMRGGMEGGGMEPRRE
ncbi:hypothetical protein GCM10010112_54970 [Actinoplanes lobatus]|uniref:Uncharacterized protein n=1 Tax=Actinoplanes lobatus TaxID=113568 RepID=A0A7W7HEZ5_9ACTN|nr:hypothetical protein [Actinoplanes lobatus]MBB4749285.1 hypothetical protein [Actinoplanes lobatus]GGN79922.1 hypothetical protein GCM10010112_54970 [Actinoplanes lobatus]GIE40224.1 hypothetical protein Alo02nite_31220 [Actinoplanes lobatus]